MLVIFNHSFKGLGQDALLEASCPTAGARCLFAQLLVFLILKHITSNKVVILSYQCLLL